MKRRSWLQIAAAAGMLLAGPLVLLAQTPTAQITGRVTDRSGGVIPGARITVVNLETHVESAMRSNDAGYFVVPFLPPGGYELSAQKEGFRSAVQKGIRLTVDQVVRVDLTLEVGAITEKVDVTAEAPLLERDTNTVGTLVDNKRIEELPLSGRNAYALIELIPGARVPVSWQDLPMDMNTTQFAMINGARSTQNEFLLNGIPNTNARTGGPGVFPNPDSVQEFRVETNAYSAEYGRAAGGVFNVVTKSGGNRFHGSLWEFHRDSAMSANNFFANRTGLKKPILTFNQFGISAGGPIRKNRTFFFTSWESARTREGVLWVGHVPTALERSGNFSATRNSAGQTVTVYDPLTIREDPARPGARLRDAFPGNTVPRERQNKVALALQEFLPASNTPGATYTGVDNFVSANPIKTDKDTFMVKLDHHISDKHRISGSLHLDHSPWVRPNAYGNVGTPSYGPQLFERRAIVLDDVYVLNPTTILNLRYGLSRTTNDRVPYSNGYDITQLGLPASYASGTVVPALPNITITGFTGVFSTGNIGNGALIGGTDTILSAFDTHSVNGSVTMIRGKHTFKTGIDLRMMRLNNFIVVEKSFSATANWTQGPTPTTASQIAGYGYASFLLGIVGGNTNFAPAIAAQDRYYGTYFQDAFKATPKLTLNYGLRYEYQAPRTDRFNQATSFDFNGPVPLKAPGLDLRGSLVFPATGGLPRGHSDPDRNNVAPRFGFAWQFAPKTVFRAGGGAFYSTSHVMADTGGLSGFSTTNAVVTSIDNLTPVNYFNNPFPNGLVYPTGSKLGAATLLGQAISFIQRRAVTPYAFQWNAGIQRQLPGAVVLDVAYVASRGLKLEDTRQYNQLPAQTLALRDVLNTSTANPFFGQIAQGTLAQANVSRSQLLRPFPHFAGVTATHTAYGKSIYHSLQVKGEKRFARGLTFLASYAFSKLMDDVTSTFAGEAVGGTSVQDWNNLRSEWAVSPFDQAHSLVCSYVWELPFGPGKRFGSSLRGAPGHILGRWQVQGVTSFQYGSPLGMTSATNTTFSAGGGQRPDWTGRNASLGDSRTVDRWFDTTQFSQPPSFTFGTGPRTMANLRAAGTKNVNFTGSKMFRIREGHSLQFRSEFFNFFNTPRFAPPGQQMLTPTFGRASTQINKARVIQLALKYIF